MVANVFMFYCQLSSAAFGVVLVVFKCAVDGCDGLA